MGKGAGGLVVGGESDLNAWRVIVPLVLLVLVLAVVQRPPSVPPAVPDNAAVLDEFLDGAREPGPREGIYRGANDTELGFIGYLSAAADNRTGIVYFHGIESHAGWFDMAATMLQQSGIDVFCLDRRGSGINREDRGLLSGHTESTDELFADIDAFVAPLRDRYERIVLVGLSWGGKLGLAYSLSRPEAVDDLVLITPGIRALVDVSLVEKLGIFATSFLAPKTRFATPIEPEMFTTTPEYLAYIKADPLRLHDATARFFMTSHALDVFVEERTGENQLPVLLYLAGNDRIIDNEGVKEVLGTSPAAVEIIEYADQTHSIQFDAPERMVADMLVWLGENQPADGE